LVVLTTEWLATQVADKLWWQWLRAQITYFTPDNLVSHWNHTSKKWCFDKSWWPLTGGLWLLYHGCHCMLFDKSRTGVTPFAVVTNYKIMAVR